MNKKEKVVVCWSGGKDSAMMLYELLRAGRTEISTLLTTVTEGYNRISMHGVRCELLEAQARSLGFPLHKVIISKGATNIEYEKKLEEALSHFKSKGVRSIAFGDIFLEDLRKYRDEHMSRIGMKGIYPIWKRDTKELIQTFIKLGFKAILSCVDPKVLDLSYSGRFIDSSFVQSLPDKIDPCGENGEFHTFVYNGPIFNNEVKLKTGERVIRDHFGFCDLIMR